MGNRFSSILAHLSSLNSQKKARRGFAACDANLSVAIAHSSGSLEDRLLLSATNEQDVQFVQTVSDSVAPEVLVDTATGLTATYDSVSGRLTITGSPGNDVISFGIQDNQMVVQLRENLGALYYTGGGSFTQYGPTRFLIFSTSADNLANVRISSGEGNDEITIADSLSSSILVEIDAGDGNDTVQCGSGSDTIIGGSGDDILKGGGGNDLIDGRDGNDQLTGGEGNDVLWGDNGNDYFYLSSIASSSASGDPRIATNGNDIIFAGTGIDTLSLGLLSGNLVFDMGSTAIQSLGSDVDPGSTLQLGSGNDLENMSGLGQGTNFILGNALDNNIVGGAFNDVLIGKEGNDDLFGGAGNDQLDGREGDDRLNGASGNDVLYGDDGNDTFEFYTNYYVDLASPRGNLPIGGYATTISFAPDSTIPGAQSYFTNEGDDVVIDLLGSTQINLYGKSGVNLTTPTSSQPVRRITDRLGFSVNIVTSALNQQFSLQNNEMG